MKPNPDIDRYLAAVPAEQRAALQSLRERIARAAPDAVECIRYRIPTFEQDGRMLVGFAAASKHCTFHLMSTTAMKSLAAELRGLHTGRGSIQFAPDSIPSAALVREVVRVRISELRGGGASRRRTRLPK